MVTQYIMKANRLLTDIADALSRGIQGLAESYLPLLVMASILLSFS